MLFNEKYNQYDRILLFIGVTVFTVLGIVLFSLILRIVPATVELSYAASKKSNHFIMSIVNDEF